MLHDEQYSSSREVFNRLLAVASLITDDMRSALREGGLTQARATALWEVARHGPITQRGLADRLRVTPRNVTTLVDALADAGLVTRAEHARDRRAVLVELTDEGRTTVARMDAEATTLAEELFGALPPADRTAVVELFDRIARRFSGETPASEPGVAD